MLNRSEREIGFVKEQAEGREVEQEFGYYDSVFATGITGEMRSKEMMQDWSSFGIIDPYLAQKTLNEAVQDSNISIYHSRKSSENIPKKAVLRKSLRQIEDNISIEINKESGDLTTTSSQQRSFTKVHYKIFKIEKYSKRSTTAKQSKANFRGDAEMKKALRFIKMSLKKLFKSMNEKVIQKRYVNCSSREIFQTMKLTLQSVIPKEFLEDDLVYYTVGILNIKKPSQLVCKQKVKREISDFIQTSNNFTYKRLKRAMQSFSLRALCRYMISQANELIAETLQKALDFE
ncbi:unnamed protein product [Moneuplotes crassus]|uniref:Uncharacterized protein n=1 Tax=Euplotes crassus TaxID=5936 RepID=A0AAD1XCX7_EUPCR|nr:unnamed protein product [Moneuplotes crassus]